jgi:hypothetical protein
MAPWSVTRLGPRLTVYGTGNQDLRGAVSLQCNGSPWTTYHVDPDSKNDFATAFSTTGSVKTLTAVSKQLYYPGDKIFLKAGTSFEGQ